MNQPLSLTFRATFVQFEVFKKLQNIHYAGLDVKTYWNLNDRFFPFRISNYYCILWG